MAHESPERPLLSGCVVSDRERARHRSRTMRYSLAAHGLAVCLLLVPLFRSPELPELAQGIGVFLYDAPPPPPPPLLSGSAAAKPEVRQATPEPIPDMSELTAPQEEPETDGIEIGEPIGVPEGMEGGVIGGQVGGVPGGVLGGVIGGTGEATEWDQPPRIIKQPRPVYPVEAALKHVVGAVLVEILIGADGNIRDARVIRSIPELDRAAIQNVYQWVFSPAVYRGRPVAVRVRGEVIFTLH